MIRSFLPVRYSRSLSAISWSIGASAGAAAVCGAGAAAGAAVVVLGVALTSSTVGGGRRAVSGIGTSDSTALLPTLAALAGKLRAARTTATAVPANRSPRRNPRIDKVPFRRGDNGRYHLAWVNKKKLRVTARRYRS